MRSSTCPHCGNVIPEWTNGVCYTCIRIEREYRRYGRRRPPLRNRPVPSSTIPRKPRSSGRVKPLQRTPRRHHDSKTPQSRLTALSGARLHPVDDLPSMRKGINCFLSDFYGSKRLLSDILSSGGIAHAEISFIRANRLEAFIAQVAYGWRRWLGQTLSSHQYHVLVDIYRLGSTLAPSIPRPSNFQHLTQVERYRIWRRAMEQLRHNGNDPLEAVVLESAWILINRRT